MLLSEFVYCKNRAKTAFRTKMIEAHAQKKNPRVIARGSSKEGEKDVAFPGKTTCKIHANPRDKTKYVRDFIQ